MAGSKPLAVVTGASSGIGLELARQFADHGYDLVVCAEDGRLGEAARDLEARGARVHAVTSDLTRYEGVEALHAAVAAEGGEVAAAALNAGVGRGGAFTESELADELEIVDLNVRSTVHLARRLLPGMVDRGSGRVLITSSIAASMPGPFQAVYNASKSFLQSFARALNNELKETGVTVTSLEPGPTDTDFFARADLEDTRLGRQKKDDPALVARQGFDALMAGEERVVAGSLRTRAQEKAERVLPDKVKSELHRRMTRPGSGS